MKKHPRWIVALAVIAGAHLQSNPNTLAADEEERGAAAARAKDPAWKPSTRGIVHRVDVERLN